jgi:hypothetical protein
MACRKSSTNRYSAVPDCDGETLELVVDATALAPLLDLPFVGYLQLHSGLAPS